MSELPPDQAGLPQGLPDDPSESFHPYAGGSNTDTLSDPAMRLKALLGKDAAEELSHYSGDPSAFVIRREVGHGTFGEVLEAVQVALHRVVAVKRPRIQPPGEDAESTDQSRLATLLFHKEALTTSHLDHPNIVPVYDLGVDAEGRPLLAMKLVQGARWDQLLQHDAGADSHERLVRHVQTLLLVSRAVAFAHSHGVVHRDLKPSQVMVGSYGEVFLMDWGSAVAMPGADIVEGMPADSFATPRDLAPNPTGTVAYMAPEQTLRTTDQLGPWTDVYLLGGILYEILTGTTPHPQQRAADAFLHAARGLVERPQERTPERQIPEDLATLCMQALTRSTVERLQDANEFVAKLEAWLSGANRRDRSRELVEQARPLLGESASDYGTLERADSLLGEALKAWAENSDALELQRKLLQRFVGAALRQGDLRLAAVQAERITAAETREQMRHAVRRAERQAARHRRQRIIAIATSLALIVVVTGLALMLRLNSERIRIRDVELERANQYASRKLHEEEIRKAEETKRGEQFRRLGMLRDLTTQFVNRAAHEIAVPSNLDTKRDWTWNMLASQPATFAYYRDTINRIRELRRQCINDGFVVSAERPELLMVDGILKLEARDSANPVEAYADFARAAEANPHRFDPPYCMALAAARGGNLTSATQAMQLALPNITTAQAGFDLAAELRKDMISISAKGFSPASDDIIIEAWNTGRNHERFTTLTENWKDVQRVLSWKSSAPGLSSTDVSGCETYGIYEPFKSPTSYPPVVARFTPNPPAPRRFFVYATWPGRGNVSPVYYRIHHADGESSVALVQDGWGELGEANSHLWVKLGEYEFRPGNDTYVEVGVNDDVRPVTPQRHGEVVADAVYFATRLLDVATTEPRIATLLDVSATKPLDNLTTAPVKWLTNLEEAKAQAQQQKRPILAFLYYPVSSIFTHRLNRYRDYCENRLFTDPALMTELREKCVPLLIDMMRDTKTPDTLGVQHDCVNICLCEPDGKVQEVVKEDALMMSPRELIAKLRAVQTSR